LSSALSYTLRPPPSAPPAFPTRRSSDLLAFVERLVDGDRLLLGDHGYLFARGVMQHSVADIVPFLQSDELLLRDHSVGAGGEHRSEEHTSELQSRFDLVCRLLLEKKKQE